MMRALLRCLGYIALSAGFVAFVVDGARYIANGEWAFLPIGTAIDAVLPGAYVGWEAAAKLRLPDYLFDPPLVRALATPFFAVAAVVAVLLLWLGRKRKAPIGYSSRD
jgi:hypothetical protein